MLAVVFGLGQELTHTVAVVNISVPIRVYDGDKFVDWLKLEDFEVYEDGKLQPIQAVYYIQKNDVKRGEAPPRSAAPVSSRHFVLLFEMNEFLPEVDTAIDFFFDNVFLRGDTLDVVTIRTTYRLREDISSKALREKTKNEIKDKIRKDVVIAGGDINSVVREMIANVEASDLDSYRTNLQQLEAMRFVDEKRMIAFAEGLKKRPGSKHIFLFFQREMIPQFSPRVLAALSNASLDMQFDLMELMTHFYRDVIIDKKAVEKAFSDASVDVHFLYVTKAARDISLDVTNQKTIDNTKMEEHSEDIYKTFREIAAVTGGIADTSANMVALMKTAAQASEQYYLLYYRPRNYADDGKFHEFSVKVKGRNYRVSHRAGYFAKDVPVEPPTPPDAVKTEPKLGTKPAEPMDEARAAELMVLLDKSAAYCRKLENAALNFVCNEDVVERLVGDGKFLTNTRTFALGHRSTKWIYDYQLIRRNGQTQEKRTLIEENGLKKNEDNAELKTRRFVYGNVFLGPLGLLSGSAQSRHKYEFVKEGKVGGEAAVVIKATPLERKTGDLVGKAWVRRQDGAVLRIEWEPMSMENYSVIEAFSRRIGHEARITVASEYSFEKNGLRFPDFCEVTEEYIGIGLDWGDIVSRTSVTYKDYKFFQVETAVDIR